MKNVKDWMSNVELSLVSGKSVENGNLTRPLHTVRIEDQNLDVRS